MKPIEILVVEDNPGDVKLFLTKFKEFKFIANYHIQTNGIDAMEFLNKEGKYNDVPKPDLLVLDIMLPRKDGITILAEMNKNKDLNDIPVVIFTSLTGQNDILENCPNIKCISISKPDSIEGYNEVIKKIENFWTQTIKIKTSN